MHWLIQQLIVPGTWLYWLISIPIAFLAVFVAAYFLVLLRSAVSGSGGRHLDLTRAWQIRGWWVGSFVIVAWLLVVEAILVWVLDWTKELPGGWILMVPVWTGTLVAVIAALIRAWPFRRESTRFNEIANRLAAVPKS